MKLLLFLLTSYSLVFICLGTADLVHLLRADPSTLPVTAMKGVVCTDPARRVGNCGYIMDPECVNSANAISSKNKRNRRLTMRFIRKAVMEPCGYDGIDLTMCCSSGGQRQKQNQKRRRPGKPKPKQPVVPPTLTHHCGIRVVDMAPETPIVPSITNRNNDDAQVEDAFTAAELTTADNIMGGLIAPEGKWPWAVILGHTNSTVGGFKVVCGGTLITNQHVLTAAHCFPDNNPGATQNITQVRLGDRDLSFSHFDGTIPVDVEVCEVIEHENYLLSTEVSNDIAIIKMCKPVNFGTYIQPACLPAAEGSWDSAGTLTVVGWGSGNTGGATTVNSLREAQVTSVSHTSCHQSYSVIGANIDADSHICALGSDDTCVSDSGGPMMATVHGSWTVVGITSFGVGCANEDFPGVYTNVAHYMDWIKDNLN